MDLEVIDYISLNDEKPVNLELHNHLHRKRVEIRDAFDYFDVQYSRLTKLNTEC
jgi:hypothetical protein